MSSGFYLHSDICSAFPTSASLNHIHKDLGSHSLTSNNCTILHPTFTTSMTKTLKRMEADMAIETSKTMQMRKDGYSQQHNLAN